MPVRWIGWLIGALCAATVVAVIPGDQGYVFLLACLLIATNIGYLCGRAIEAAERIAEAHEIVAGAFCLAHAADEARASIQVPDAPPEDL